MIGVFRGANSRRHAAVSAALLTALGFLACGGARTIPGSATAAAPDRTPLPAAPKTLNSESLPAQQTVTESATLDVLQEELTRAFTELGESPDAPYFMSYQVTETVEHVVTASHGGLLEGRDDHRRLLDVDLRLGSPKRDNTHALPGDEGLSTYRGASLLPLTDNGAAFTNAVWVATNSEYERARQDLMRVTSSVELKASDEPVSDDFSVEQPSVYLERPLETAFDRAEWEEKLATVSALAKRYPDLMHSSVGLHVQTQTRFFTSSAGARIQLSGRHLRVSLSAETLARDGAPLQRFESIDASSLEALPDEAVLRQRFLELLEELSALKQAPLVEPYVGPAILDGRAAGVFFHEVLGHRLEGHRQDAKAEGQTFAKMVGQRIMPAKLNVYDDPRLSAINGVELNGFYPYDDEGVPARRASLVEAGILSGFLLSRAPIRGFAHSNGHGRKQAGHRVVARQANLVVDPVVAVTPTTLKQALLDEVRRQGLTYGLRFTEIAGGYTQTQRYDTQAFKVIPVMVYRVFLDGREELVRGVDIEGTPLLALSKIVAAANDFEVFNGVCGAESGWVPVSAVSPSLLLSQIEVARQQQFELVPPLLSAPSAEESR